MERRTYMMSNSNKLVKDRWESEKLMRFEVHDDHDSSAFGFTWPPKNYNCSFCKREFKSAQALGGHMNVHRRERARLRHFTPSLVLDHQCTTTANPRLNINSNSCNPNPNFSSSSSSSKLLPFPYTNKSLLISPSLSSSTTTTTPFTSSSPSSASCTNEEKKVQFLDITKKKKKSMKNLPDHRELMKGFAEKYEVGQLLKKHEVINLDLEMSIIKDPKEVLDLELRLGYF